MTPGPDLSYLKAIQDGLRPSHVGLAAAVKQIATFRLPDLTRQPNRYHACILCGKLTKQGICGSCWPKAQAMLEEERRKEAEQQASQEPTS